jgi:uncharacterized protein (TIGR03083 family)
MGDAKQASWLPGDAYDALRAADFQRFCAAAQADYGARVPTCPEWDVTALCDHLARVYQGRSYVIANGAFLDSDAFEPREEGDDPLAWVRRWSDDLDRSLLSLADDAPTVTFMPDGAECGVHFWRRRMALETLVHRTDAEIAVGDVSAMDDELSADGVDEMLWFLSHPEMDPDDGIASTEVIELTDGARRWPVAISEHAIETAAPGVPADLLLTVSGRDLEGLGASRFGVEPLVVEGDPAAFDRLRQQFVGF